MVQYVDLDASFSALADGTRRGILEQLRTKPATITELAEQFDMTLTGIKKHVRLLEDAGMVTTEKQGRVRFCHAGANLLENEIAWMRNHQAMVSSRMDHLAAFLEQQETDQ
jgi:DNA-binding transcriptional ArsR family regulator